MSQGNLKIAEASLTDYDKDERIRGLVKELETLRGEAAVAEAAAADKATS